MPVGYCKKEEGENRVREAKGQWVCASVIVGSRESHYSPFGKEVYEQRKCMKRRRIRVGVLLEAVEKANSFVGGMSVRERPLCQMGVKRQSQGSRNFHQERLIQKSSNGLSKGFSIGDTSIRTAEREDLFDTR